MRNMLKNGMSLGFSSHQKYCANSKKTVNVHYFEVVTLNQTAVNVLLLTYVHKTLFCQ